MRRIEGTERTRRPRTARWLVVVVAGVTIGLAGCGGASSGLGVAGGQPTTTTGASPNDVSSQPSSNQARLLQYAQCMRSHGVTNFPDPDSQGHIHVTPGAFPNQGSPQFQAAQKTCDTLLPGGHQSPAQRNANALKFTQCMRSHGVADFPDPNGKGTIEINNPTGDLNPNSAAFLKAQNSCQSLDKGFNMMESGAAG